MPWWTWYWCCLSCLSCLSCCRRRRNRQPNRERRGRLRHGHPLGRGLRGAHVAKRLPRRERVLLLQHAPYRRRPRPQRQQLDSPVDPTRELLASRPTLGHTPFYYHASRPIPPRPQTQRAIELEPTYCIQVVMACLPAGHRRLRSSINREGTPPSSSRASTTSGYSSGASGSSHCGSSSPLLSSSFPSSTAG